jgi:3-hydroxy-9,10-secoandrosta-1,3,5(10)-triene-9,17-dione monooxygenase reductase component
MTIHATDPFATPDDSKSAVRRLRGRLAAPVTLWTAYGADGRPAGLTVSSTVVVEGAPGAVLGVLDAESDLFAAVAAAGRFAVVPLALADTRLADIFAGVMPAPGGGFAQGRWRRTEYGPVPEDATAWALCRLSDTRNVGWGRLVESMIESAIVADSGVGEQIPLVHYRGRYRGAYERRPTAR